MISMIAFGLFLVMRITLARYYLVEIQDDVVGEIAGRGGISIQFRNRSTADIFMFGCNILVTLIDIFYIFKGNIREYHLDLVLLTA